MKQKLSDEILRCATTLSKLYKAKKKLYEYTEGRSLIDLPDQDVDALRKIAIYQAARIELLEELRFAMIVEKRRKR